MNQEKTGKFIKENKIYDVGGYWYYSGKNNIKVKVKRNKKGYI